MLVVVVVGTMRSQLMAGRMMVLLLVERPLPLALELLRPQARLLLDAAFLNILQAFLAPGGIASFQARALLLALQLLRPQTRLLPHPAFLNVLQALAPSRRIAGLQARMLASAVDILLLLALLLGHVRLLMAGLRQGRDRKRGAEQAQRDRRGQRPRNAKTLVLHGLASFSVRALQGAR